MNTFETQTKDSQLAKNEVAIFRTSEPNVDFTLKIDSVFNYRAFNENKNITCCYKIGTIKKTANKASNVYIRINGQDTSFKIQLFGIDSIIFGRGSKRFYVATNLNKEAWLSE